jgi:hypothetical protein
MVGRSLLSTYIFARGIMGNINSFTVAGSHGMVEADAETGRILDSDVYCGYECEDCHGAGYGNIERFNTEEWKATYSGRELRGQALDTLDLGYWLKDGTYEPPEEHWRANEFPGGQKKTEDL